MPVVVFDFDQTLTERHLFHTLHNEAIRASVRDGKWIGWDETVLLGTEEFIVDYIFGGEERLRKLRRFLQELSNRGVHLAISSAGQTNEIEMSLETLRRKVPRSALTETSLGQSLFAYIHARNTETGRFDVRQNTSFDSRFMQTVWSPANRLTKQLEAQNKLAFLKVMQSEYQTCVAFVDDDPREYEAAQRIGVITIAMPRTGGLGDDEMALVREALTRCVSCKLAGAELECLRCSARYCEEQCQRSHWPVHKLTCTVK